MSEGPYISSEDSSLFREVLARYSGGRCLEIGAGNGGGLLVLSHSFSLVVGTDLVRPAMRDWERVSDFIVTDVAACIAGSSFDLVAFNPPYLRGPVEDRAVDGGVDLEVPLRFLAEALRVVKRDGKVLMLVNDGADIGALEAVCAKSGFGLRMVGERRLFYERLAVYEASAAGCGGA